MAEISSSSTPVQRRKRQEELIYTKDELSYCLSKYHDSLAVKLEVSGKSTFFSSATSFGISGIVSSFCCEFVDKWGLTAQKIESRYLLIHGTIVVIGVIASFILYLSKKSKQCRTKEQMIADCVEQEWKSRTIESSPSEDKGKPIT